MIGEPTFKSNENPLSAEVRHAFDGPGIQKILTKLRSERYQLEQLITGLEKPNARKIRRGRSQGLSC